MSGLRYDWESELYRRVSQREAELSQMTAAQLVEEYEFETGDLPFQKFKDAIVQSLVHKTKKELTDEFISNGWLPKESADYRSK